MTQTEVFEETKPTFPCGLLVVFRTCDKEGNLHREGFRKGRDILQDPGNSEVSIVLDEEGEVLGLLITSAVSLIVPLPPEVVVPSNANH